MRLEYLLSGKIGHLAANHVVGAGELERESAKLMLLLALLSVQEAFLKLRTVTPKVVQVSYYLMTLRAMTVSYYYNNNYYTVNCEWEYGDYERCSKTCGEGVKKRFPIITQHPENGGRPCPPDVQREEPEVTSCNLGPCAGK